MTPDATRSIGVYPTSPTCPEPPGRIGEYRKAACVPDMSESGPLDAVAICVPTPLRKTKYPDLSQMLSAVQKRSVTCVPSATLIPASSYKQGFVQTQSRLAPTSPPVCG